MVLVGTSCFDGVLLAKIVISGSQFMTKLDQIFYHFLTDLILFLLFMVLSQGNHKVVEACFFLMSSWMAFKWIAASGRVSGILLAMFFFNICTHFHDF